MYILQLIYLKVHVLSIRLYDITYFRIFYNVSCDCVTVTVTCDITPTLTLTLSPNTILLKEKKNKRKKKLLKSIVFNFDTQLLIFQHIHFSFFNTKSLSICYLSPCNALTSVFFISFTILTTSLFLLLVFSSIFTSSPSFTTLSRL